MTYEFKNLTTGTSCCRTNNPNHLCPKCKAQLSAQSAAQAEGPAPAPSLIDSVREKRGLPALPSHKLAVPLGPASPTTLTEAPEPPSLRDAIIAGRKAGRR